MLILSNRLLSLLLGLAAALILPSQAAFAWWNDDWSLRREITIDTSATGANLTEEIGGMPVLVRLHTGNFQFNKAQDNGADLRFVAGDDKTPLKHHVEKFDSLLGEALVWVYLPDVKPGAKTTFFLYYDNKKAASGEDPKATYDAATSLIWHFAEHAAPIRDYSPWGNPSPSAGPTIDGSLIGPGLSFDGHTIVTLPTSPSLTWGDGNGVTWSAWVRLGAPQPNEIIYARRDGAAALRIGADNGSPFIEITDATGVQRTAPGTVLDANGWHNLSVVSDAQKTTLFVDGTAYGELSKTVPPMVSAATLGGDTAAAIAAPAPAPAKFGKPVAAEPAAAPGSNYTGELDELEIAKVARPAGFVRATTLSQGPDVGSLVTIGPDEETASWISGYFAVILRSVTIDGWVVIGLLAVMAALSWFVMFDKASYVGRQAKANTRFLDRFDKFSANLSVLDRASATDLQSLGGALSKGDGSLVRHSALYRIFIRGAEEIQTRRQAQRGKPLSGASIAAIRAALDAGLVRETQRLNKQMVLLTLAISGGPFLGLLGTVVGVMITFAAIAQSGDVNINSIAPGIAAALVATVAGLIVAIPALFGYNYLITRIKNATSDMQVFVDEFIAKTAEAFGSSEV